MSARRMSSHRSNSVQGSARDQQEYLLNPVMLAAVGYQTSKFDKELENDFEGCDETLPVRNPSSIIMIDRSLRHHG